MNVQDSAAVDVSGEQYALGLDEASARNICCSGPIFCEQQQQSAPQIFSTPLTPVILQRNLSPPIRAEKLRVRAHPHRGQQIISEFNIRAMGKTKPHSKKPTKKNGKPSGTPKKPKMTPEQLLAEATVLLHTSQPEDALVAARRALAQLQPDTDSPPTTAALPALNLLGEISVELGDAETARDYFLVAAALDEDGQVPEAQGGGAEKFLWLAQLCEEGGAESVAWFDKGAEVLRGEIAALEAQKAGPERDVVLDEKKRKLANALCGIVEVFMTDLS